MSQGYLTNAENWILTVEYQYCMVSPIRLTLVALTPSTPAVSIDFALLQELYIYPRLQ